MGKCSGCGDRCGCILEEGANISISGVGTSENPYVIEGGGGGGGGAPPGAILMFGSSVAPPGFLVCDGSARSRVAFADLYAAIGTIWGDGDGSSTFNIPDLQDRFPVGAGSVHDLGVPDPIDQGVESIVIGQPNLPPHIHDLGGHAHSIDHTHSGGQAIMNSMIHKHEGNVDGNGEHSHGVSISVGGQKAGSSSGSNVMNQGGGPYGTGTQPNHGHHFFTNDTDTSHTHGVSHQAFGGGSGGPNANSGAGPGSSQALKTIPPHVGVTFIIKT